MKDKYYYPILAFIIFITISKCYFIYDYFNENYLPVYDGVMYEKNQILRYFNFENNFSILQRYSQMIYEFKGNHVSSIFNIIIILFAPKLLISDWDIFIRGIASLFILYHSIYSFLGKDKKLTLLIYSLLISIPTIYNFRFGIFTYIPDIISGILLLSSYFYLITFLNTNKYNHIYFATILIGLAIGFRFNFFVYSTLVFIPIYSLIIIKFLKENKNTKKTILILINGLIILLIGLYIFQNLKFFLKFFIFFINLMIFLSTLFNLKSKLNL